MGIEKGENWSRAGRRNSGGRHCMLQRKCLAGTKIYGDQLWPAELLISILDVLETWRVCSSSRESSTPKAISSPDLLYELLLCRIRRQLALQWGSLTKQNIQWSTYRTMLVISCKCKIVPQVWAISIPWNSWALFSVRVFEFWSLGSRKVFGLGMNENEHVILQRPRGQYQKHIFSIGTREKGCNKANSVFHDHDLSGNF